MRTMLLRPWRDRHTWLVGTLGLVCRLLFGAELLEVPAPPLRGVGSRCCQCHPCAGTCHIRPPLQPDRGQAWHFYNERPAHPGDLAFPAPPIPLSPCPAVPSPAHCEKAAPGRITLEPGCWESADLTARARPHSQGSAS